MRCSSVNQAAARRKAGRSALHSEPPPTLWSSLHSGERMCACLLMLPLVAAGAATGVAAAAVQHEPAAAAAKPHLLYALVDDLGWYNVQLHNPKIRTPHFVELRSQGILLDRHYTFKYCSPSRNSLMSGRLPIHVKEDNGWVGGVPQNMTVVAAKLKEAGYATHQIGKWHAGAATLNHVPAGRPWSDGGRGFDTSLGYLHCCEDHFKQTILHATDYWANATPAFGMNATLNAAGVLNYCTHNYVAEATRVLSLHDPSTPMFMFMAFHNNHGPLQVTPWYKRYYPEDPEDPDAMVGSRATYNGMTTAWDDGLKNITALFKAKGMWSRTVLVMSSDNGGPIYGGGAANNYPHRGGKMSNWEGGVRTIALVSGGFIAKDLWGTTAEGYIHICDWYATLCELAGVNPVDALAAAAGLPPIDSISQWKYITSLAKGTPPVPPPRTLLPLGSANHFADDASGALIRGSDHIKLIYGPKICEDIWTSDLYPNSTWGIDEVQAGSAVLLDFDEVHARFFTGPLGESEKVGVGLEGSTILLAAPCSGNRSQLWQLGATASERSAGSTITQPWVSNKTRCWRHGCHKPTGIKLAEQACTPLPHLQQNGTYGCGGGDCNAGALACVVGFSFGSDGSIRSLVDGKCVAIEGGSRQISIQDCQPGAVNQRWAVKSADSGLFTISNSVANQALCVEAVPAGTPPPGPSPPGPSPPGPPKPPHGNPRSVCQNCSEGCMFNISADPGEHIDLAKDPAHASLLAEMIALYEKEVNQTYWQHTEAENYDDCNYGSNCPAQAAMEKYGGYCECTLVLHPCLQCAL